MAHDGFEGIRDEEVIVPLKVIEPIGERQVVNWSSSALLAPPPPQPQLKRKRNKTKLILTQQNIPARETRSKTVKPSANTRSKSKI